MLGVGIIGCGAISKMHIEAFENNPHTQIRGVASKSEESAKKAGERLSVPWYTDYRELLEREDIQLISVCTPSGLHMETVLYAAERGIHAIVEKPLEISTERIDCMVEACKRNHVLLGSIFNNRYTDAHRFLKRAVDAGRLGTMLNVNGSVRWYRKPSYYADSSWRGTWALDGGGALMNQSIHYVDLLLWLAGEAESVSAYTGTLLHKSIETEDTAALCVRFRCGALGTFVGTTSSYPGYPAELQLTGTRGSVTVTDGAITAWNFLDEDPLDEEAKMLMATGTAANNRAADPMAFAAQNHCREIDAFVDAILQGWSAPIDGAEARKSVAFIETVYRSAKSGKRENIL